MGKAFHVNKKTKICLVIGNPISHSLSPVMHNAAYNTLKIDDTYIMLSSKIESEELSETMKYVREFNIHALACTIPYKEKIMDFLDVLDEDAKKIGAVNSVINDKGVLYGCNTDWQGAINALVKKTALKNKKVAILGSGGTARAIAYGLYREGCTIKIFSRNINKAIEFTKKYGCETGEWEDRQKAVDAEIIINTTPIGRDDDNTPLSYEGITKNHIVMDVNYRNGNTPLINLVKLKNAISIDGREMLLQQGMLQFELFTGLKAPEEAMRKAIER